MKKTLAYTSAAILLGIASMMLPLILQTTPTYLSPLTRQLLSTPNETSGVKGGDSSVLRFFEDAVRPSNLLPSSLIFSVGLVAGVCVYAVFKKRMI